MALFARLKPLVACLSALSAFQPLACCAFTDFDASPSPVPVIPVEDVSPQYERWQRKTAADYNGYARQLRDWERKQLYWSRNTEDDMRRYESRLEVWKQGQVARNQQVLSVHEQTTNDHEWANYEDSHKKWRKMHMDYFKKIDEQTEQQKTRWQEHEAKVKRVWQEQQEAAAKQYEAYKNDYEERAAAVNNWTKTVINDQLEASLTFNATSYGLGSSPVYYPPSYTIPSNRILDYAKAADVFPASTEISPVRYTSPYIDPSAPLIKLLHQADSTNSVDELHDDSESNFPKP